jgi:uncharacterized protein YjbI with pentapeptide repeats/DNA-binding XRE family transcriptional regulator
MSLSQAQLAKLLFISPQAVGKWERGESFPDIITFARLAKSLGVDLNYFSEDFLSTSAGATSDEPLGKQSAGLPTKKQRSRLRWDMSLGNWVDADFSGLKNLHEKFSSSNMKNCRFVGSDLSGLLLKSNNIDSCDFSGSDMSKSHIKGSNLVNNLYKNCSLTETEFSGSNVDRCDFSGANLNGTVFSKTFIYGCDFTGSDLTGVVVKFGGFSRVSAKSSNSGRNTIADAVWNQISFIDSQITDIVFTGKLEDCSFENCVFTRVTFQNVSLINTFFKNNNLKRIRFIDCKADRMTYEFLKNGKADLSGISLV